MHAGASKELMTVRDGTPSLGGCFVHAAALILHREHCVLCSSILFNFCTDLPPSFAGMEYEWTSGVMR